MLPLPKRPQTAVTPQQRGLEVTRQPHQNPLVRSHFTEGSPKAADVGAAKHRQRLAEEPAEQRNAFRQFFQCPPNAPVLVLGGRWRPRASAGQTESLIAQCLEPSHLQTPIRHHPRRDHTPGPPAARTQVTLHVLNLGPFHSPIPAVGPVPMPPLSARTARTFLARTRTLARLQRRCINLHPQRLPLSSAAAYPTLHVCSALRPSASPPACSQTGSSGLAPAPEPFPLRGLSLPLPRPPGVCEQASPSFTFPTGPVPDPP